MVIGRSWSKNWTFFEDNWHEGNVPMMGRSTRATWLGSMVFDEARAFEEVTPDLALHCARVNESAGKLYLKPVVSVDTRIHLTHESIEKLDKDAALHIGRMYWAEHEGPWIQAHDPDSTRWWCLTICEAPMRRSNA